MKSYNKLVRDKIPQIIVADNQKPVIRQLDQKEYFIELIKKLKEETAEFEKSRSVEELADMKEVLIALREAMGIRAGELEDVRRHKAKDRGRFKKRIYLEKIE